jgi:AcrR family transcriptional regulator
VRSPREELLDRCLEALQRKGFSDLSLRGIASAAGTSHRMLIYHFGSREGLLAAVVGRIEAEQRGALAELAARPGSLAEAGRAFWRRVADPSLAPAERLFFEVYVQALHGREGTGGLREAVITAWERPLVELFVSHGVSPGRARAHVRLGLAVTRGLLLDLLLTGERDVVDDAYELFAELSAMP